MTARCDRCGRFDAHPTGVIVQAASPYQGEDDMVLCARCAGLHYSGWSECHESVTDSDGVEVPCERPAYGVRIDPTFGGPYPVCRRHCRPPYQMCEWGQWYDGPLCLTHDGRRSDESDWCDRSGAWE